MTKLASAWHHLWFGTQQPVIREVKSNHDTHMLKILACALMLCDHLGKMIFPDATVLRFAGEVGFYLPSLNILRAIGRLAMPMFAYCIAVGCNYTRNIWKYALRLLILGILVHPLYQEAMGHVTFRQFDWKVTGFDQFLKQLLEIYRYYFQGKNLNILFTLFLGTLIIACVRHKRWFLLPFAILLTVRLHNRVDYGYEGVFLILLFYAFLEHPVVSCVAAILFFVNWSAPQLFVQLPFRLVKSGDAFSIAFNKAAFKPISSELYAILSLIFIYLPIRKRYVRLPKRFFYAFYPAHLLLIYFLLLYK